MAKDLLIKIDTKLTILRPGFGVVVSDINEPSLNVPMILGEDLKARHISTASGLLSFARAFPDVMASNLGITSENVQRNTAELITILRGHIENKFLEINKPFNVGFGVIQNLI